jgi:ferrous-iron efflux pump FieF
MDSSFHWNDGNNYASADGHMHTHSHPTIPATRQEKTALMHYATYASVSMALVLLTAKIIAWWSSDSLSMLSSLTDSLFDVVTSVVNLIAVRYALKPADEDHRFGHTSIEDIAGLGQFAFISASMALIILQSVERLFNPRPLAHEMIGIWVSLGAIALTLALVTYQGFVSKRTGSLIIASDRMHYVGDVMFNTGVLLALFLSLRFGIIWADPAIAMAIAVIVLWSTREIGIRAFNNLMDREMPDVEKEKIFAIVKAIPEIQSIHQMKTRHSGTKAFIQMHIDISDTLGFVEAHDITERLEEALLAVFPEAEVIIHPDPVAV